MSLCCKTGRFLWEAFPQFNPHGYCTETEMELWGLFYRDLNERRDRRKTR